MLFKRFMVALLGGGAVLVSATIAVAQTITVELRRNGVFDSPGLPPFASGAAIPLDLSDNANGEVEFIRVYTTGGGNAASIGRITLSGTRASSNQINLLIGTGTAINETASVPLQEVAQSWSGIGGDDSLTSLIRLSGAISDDLKAIAPATSGSVRVGRIVRLQVGDQVQAEVRTVGDGEAFQQLVAKSVPAEAGQIIAEQGNINSITIGTTTSDGLHASVIAQNGWIFVMEVAGPIELATPKKISAKNGIYGILASAVDATIIADDNDGFGPFSGVWAMEGCIRGSIRCRDADGSGSYSGIISYHHAIQADIEVRGNLGALISGNGSGCDSLDAEYSVGRVVIHGDIKSLVTGALGVREVVCHGDIHELGGISSGTRIDRVQVDGDMQRSSAQSLFMPSIGAPVIDSVVIDGSAELELNTSLLGSGQNLGSLRIGGDCAGILRVRNPGEIRIGGSLLALPEPALSFLRVFGPLPSDSTIQIGGSALAPILVDGLHGQVVVNAAQSGGVMGSTVDVDVPIGEFELTPLPHYSAPSSSFGGGAVGLVPYALHKEDCVPPAGTQSVPARFTQTGFNNGGGIVLTEYGRLTLVGGTAPVTISRGTTDVTTLFDATIGASGNDARRVTVRPRAVGYPAQRLPVPVATYLIQPTNALRCADTFNTTNPPAVAPFEYWVCVVRDCDNDGQPDDAGCSTQTCAPGTGNCLADCDDGSGTGIPDDGVTIDDLLYYLALFEAGNINADIDDGTCDGVRDGGVTIDDLLCFISHFDAGC